MYQEYFIWAVGKNARNSPTVYHWLRTFVFWKASLEIHVGIDHSKPDDSQVVNIMLVVQF